MALNSIETTNNNNDSMRTAIETSPIQANNRGILGRIRDGISTIFDMIGSETALVFYLLLHWLNSCCFYIVFNGKYEDTVNFVGFVYFVALIMGFLATMTHFSICLIPLLAVSYITECMLLLILSISLIRTDDSAKVIDRLCGDSFYYDYCMDMYERKSLSVYIMTLLVNLLFMFTTIAIFQQFKRNEIFNANIRAHPHLAIHQLHPMYINPHLVTNQPIIVVGAQNPDEPPRYSVLERVTVQVDTEVPQEIILPAQSCVTSPPRYSYWERTWGGGKKREGIATPVTARSTTSVSTAIGDDHSKHEKNI